MRGTRGGLLAIVVGLAALAPLVGNGGAAASPNALLLDPIPAHFVSPTYVTAPPGDATRVFVVEQGGTIQLYKNSTVSLFMTVPGVTSGGERGLLSMAFAPDYATSGIFYAYCTRSQAERSRSTSFIGTRRIPTQGIRPRFVPCSRFRIPASRATTAASCSSAQTGCSISPQEMVAAPGTHFVRQ